MKTTLFAMLALLAPLPFSQQTFAQQAVPEISF